MDMISPEQCRAARALLNWSQPDLADKCDMHVQTISSFENGTSSPTKRTLQKLANTLIQHSIQFLPNDGVCIQRSEIRRYSGRKGFKDFYDDLYNTANTIGGEICLYNGVSDLIVKWLGDENRKIQVERMQKIKHKIHFKIIVEYGDSVFFGATYGDYRWFPAQLFNNKTFYIYGSKIAFVNFDNNDVNVIVLEQKEMADSQRLLFNLAWDNVAVQPSVPVVSAYGTD